MSPMKRPAVGRDSMYGETVSIAGAARRLQISKKQIRKLMGTGKLNFVQIRSEFRLPLLEIEKLSVTELRN